MPLGPRTSSGEALALTGAKIYPSPTDQASDEGVVLFRGGKVSAVGKAGDFAIPTGATVLDCHGSVVTAGFQNSHVHLDGRFSEASTDELANTVRNMMTRYGFTTVVDAGSFLPETSVLRSRIATGEVPGPRILTAGGPVFPDDGVPFYLKLPAEIARMLVQPKTPKDAVLAVRRNISAGADIVKLFTGSLVSPTKVKVMPRDIAGAAVAEAHRLGKPVYTHPSNALGIQVAMDSGVDVLAHTASAGEVWGTALVAAMVSNRMSLIPTLKLWLFEAAKGGATKAEGERWANRCAGQLNAFFRGGGRILFGTDAGYMTDYDPMDEYRLMTRAGMPPMQILASLTTAPAEFLGESLTRGRIAPGMDADVVVLTGDPLEDPLNFGRVKTTIRKGQVIYSSR